MISQIEWVWDGVVIAKVARYGPMSMGEPLDSYGESYGESVIGFGFCWMLLVVWSKPTERPQETKYPPNY